MKEVREANQRRTSEGPEGPLAIGSPFYVERPVDAVASQICRAGIKPLVLLGPRGAGKSSLLKRLLEEARQAGRPVALVRFAEINERILLDQTQLFRTFCVALSRSLDLPDVTDEYWNSPLSDVICCNRYVTRYLLQARGSLLVALDDVECLTASSYREDFLGMLRTWYVSRATSVIWHRLDMILVSSIQPDRLMTHVSQSPFNVSEQLTLDDLTRMEAVELDQRYGKPFGPGLLSSLFELTNGHPLLLQLALQAAASGRTRAEDLLRDPTGSASPFTVHLRTLLQRVLTDAGAAHAFRDVIRRQRSPFGWDASSAPPEAEPYLLLESLGLVRTVKERLLPRCPLYAQFFGQAFDV